MFICEKCKKSSSPREKENKIVVETRTKVYPDRNVGTEIVKEISVCSECLTHINNKSSGQGKPLNCPIF